MDRSRDMEVVGRFYEAIHALVREKSLRGKKTFTDRYGINRWNFLTVEKNHASEMFKVSWLSHLVKDYGISAKWLLTGKGQMKEAPMNGPRVPNPKKSQAH